MKRVQPLPAVEAQQRRQQVRIALGAAAGDGTGCRPAAAPAGRCPGCWPRRRARALTMRSICACVSCTSGSISRRDVGRSPRECRWAAHRFARPCAWHRRWLRQLRQLGCREQRAHVQRASSRRRSRSTSCTASSEWPPSSKKLSCRPTRSTLQQLAPDAAPACCSISPCRRLVARAARRPRLRAPAAPCGRACRWASAAARPAPRRRGHHVLGQARAQVRAQRRRLDAPRSPTT